MSSEQQVTCRTLAVRKLSHRSREREAIASGEKASSLPPRRRQGASREPRRGVNFATGEIEELVKTSQIVPVSAPGQLVHSDIVLTTGLKAGGRMRKNSIDSDTASTMAPTSAESSPMLAFVVADANATTWPSLREASAPGWDFCSDASDDEELWQDLPEPAVSLDDDSTSEQSSKKSDASPASWCYVPAKGYVPPLTMQSEVPEVSEPNSKPSFADVVREQPTDQAGHVLPPAPGALMPTIRAQPLQRRNAANSTQHDGDVADEVNEELEFGFLTQYHGWTKQHKASRSKRYQRGLAHQMACRADQRTGTSQNCGELELED